jgi:hypothetical protein
VIEGSKFLLISKFIELGIHMNNKTLHRASAAVIGVCLTFVLTATAWAQSKNLAPNFSARPQESKLVVVPVDIELFSLSAGGVTEPKADWTQNATKHFNSSLKAKSNLLGANVSNLQESDLDEFAELNSLHGAVATSVFIHHMLAAAGGLPTKEGKLLWSLGDAVKPLREKTGADYALFTWVRDSYASAERKAAIVVMAVLGVGLAGGTQIGYASLVDLKTGQVVWFNNLARGSGDLREEKPALETVEALLKGFPAAK